MKTTEAHFKIFKIECEKWIARFGLTDWFVDFYHEDWSESCGEGDAWCRWVKEGRAASLCLNTSLENIDGKSAPAFLRRLAVHEVAHILFARIQDLAKSRFVEVREIEEEIHVIIRRLENVFSKGKRYGSG